MLKETKSGAWHTATCINCRGSEQKYHRLKRPVFFSFFFSPGEHAAAADCLKELQSLFQPGYVAVFKNANKQLRSWPEPRSSSPLCRHPPSTQTPPGSARPDWRKKPRRATGNNLKASTEIQFEFAFSENGDVNRLYQEELFIEPLNWKGWWGILIMINAITALPAPPPEADVRDKLILRSMQRVTYEREGPDDPLKGIEMIARTEPTSSKGSRFCKIHFADVFPVLVCHWPVSELPTHDRTSVVSFLSWSAAVKDVCEKQPLHRITLSGEGQHLLSGVCSALWNPWTCQRSNIENVFQATCRKLSE